MSQAFAGTLLLPGEDGPGLDAVLETVERDIKLVAGESELGSWTQDDCTVTSTGRGSFEMVLGGEVVLFTPDTPTQFAEALLPVVDPDGTSVPLAARIESESKGKKQKKAKSRVESTRIEPLKSVGKDEVLGRPLTFVIIAVSCLLIAALLMLSTSL
ncbi:MAG: hypothetical protein DWP92_05460 [Armatimonadetes bacterium]|nr:MAG: hypothetical protein DWP92_05460 [Armatimonadota bacterium]